MKRISTLIAVFLAAAALILPWTSQANAQYFFTYVSHAGNDANTCNSPEAACRFFDAALLKTNDGGVITMNERLSTRCASLKEALAGGFIPQMAELAAEAAPDVLLVLTQDSARLSVRLSS